MLDTGAGASGRGGEVNIVRNLNGQKLGRKGRDTRARILAAARDLVDDPASGPVSMSGIARRADLGMTSLYLYFADLTEVLLALLDPVIEEGRAEFAGLLGERWPDAGLAGHCRALLDAYHGYWSRHSHLLHLRNTLADGGDQRILTARVSSSLPVMAFFTRQMDGDPAQHASPAYAMATVLATAVERIITSTTDPKFTGIFGPGRGHEAEHYLAPAARLMELSIQDMRRRQAAA